MTTEHSALVTISDPDSPAAEAYRALRTNLAFAGLDKPLRTLMITSPGAEEGKSTVLANLGVSLAQGEQRVLIIDADLRQPSQHILFGLRNDEGLTSMLINAEAAARPPVQETTVPGLRVLTSGPLPPRPADLLGSKRMMDVLARLKEEADLLLFDSPPINALADAAAEGDRSENAEYIYRKRQLRQIDSRLRFLSKRLDHVVIVDPREQKRRDRIFFGATVTVEDEEGKSFSYRIVGQDEIEGGERTISWKSPVGKALLGKSVGDTVVVRWHAGMRELTVVKIEYPT